MSDTKRDGGPAFPSGQKEWGGTGWKEITEAQHKGLMLRDWFAGQALIGMLANPGPAVSRQTGGHLEKTPELLASFAYQYADTLLAEREK